MRIDTWPRSPFHALSIGAACGQLAGKGRVHSLFPSTLNIALESGDILISLTGPEGRIFPHALALGGVPQFPSWPVSPGDPVSFDEGRLVIEGRAKVEIDLGAATSLPKVEVARIAGLGRAYRACLASLAGLQALRGCDLAMGCLGREAFGGEGFSLAHPTALSQALASAALGLAEALQRPASPASLGKEPDGLGEALSSLLGLGSGLTPSGDDFLCGILASLRSASPAGEANEGLAALRAALSPRLGLTTDISASFLRCAILGFFPAPLLSLAQALADADLASASEALISLSLIGHSSGLDLACGFLFGLGLHAPWVGHSKAAAPEGAASNRRREVA
jgi:hypothetical protein